MDYRYILSAISNDEQISQRKEYLNQYRDEDGRKTVEKGKLTYFVLRIKGII